MEDKILQNEHLSYILNELGENHEDYFNAIAPPIVQTSNFLFSTVEDMRHAFSHEYDVYIYSRGNNPTVEILKQKLAALDNAEDCLVVNSGSSAIFNSVLPFVKAGAHIVSVKNPYSWAKKLFDDFLPKFGVTTTYIDGTDILNFERAIQPGTSIIYLESPNSWMFEIQDLKAVSALAKSKNITTIIDNSYCTPLFQKPLDFGIDIAIQSATKYIGGHSDVLGGVICSSKENIRKIFNSEYNTAGNGCTPFNAWLLLRGLRTLPARLKQVNDNTSAFILGMESLDIVEKIIFPFHPSFPQYALAKEQMLGACGLLTIIVKEEYAPYIEQLCNHLKAFKMAVSWGGYESLVIPKIAALNKNNIDFKNEEHRSIRIYVGLESPDYLLNDLKQAVEKAKG